MANHHDNNNNISDLDDLLDSALDDFHTLNLTNPSHQRSKELKEESVAAPMSSSSSSEVQGLGLGLGLGLPGLKAKKGKQKHKATTQQPNHVSEALDKLREQTKEAVKGLQAVTDAPDKPVVDDAIMEDWVKQFEDLAGSQDMESIMETMMQQLLSKEILHEPMKEIGERYPKWLEEHEASLSKDEYERFSNQYNLIKSLNQVYEKEPGNYNKIVELMQKMQECGQPPNDILNELAPDFDLATLGQLSPEMLESQPNCCVM